MTRRPAVAPSPAARLATARPYPLGGIRLESGPWRERQATTAATTLRVGAEQLERAGNVHSFMLVADRGSGPHGHADAVDSDVKNFVDTDVYKWLEAVAWTAAHDDVPSDVRAAADRMVDLVLAAQDEDGYLNTWYQTQDRSQRFSNLAFCHELYCLGHLVQAAVAWHRALGDDRLLSAARRFADLVVRVFGSTEAVCGHPEVEMALVELTRETGDRRYAELARTLVDRRGHGLLGEGRFGAAYYQDDQPYRAAPTLSGHAVRAVYLAAGAVDVAVELEDADLLAASRRQWEAVVARRTYVTGGIGSRHHGESFGLDWELPPDRAYAETCAAIGLVMWSWRLLLTQRDSRVADLIERAVYNAVLSGVSPDGTAFHYTNPLDVHDAHPRQPWFEIACCPPNAMRTVATLDQLVATHDDAGVTVHQLTSALLDDGRGRVLRMRTHYPADGHVELTILASPGTWTLAVRQPGWASAAAVRVGSAPLDITAGSDGYLSITRDWAVGDTVEIDLPMDVRLVTADPRVGAARGAVAVERGPVVYTLQAPDGLDDDGLALLAVPPRAEGRAVPGADSTVPNVRLPLVRRPAPHEGSWPYPPLAADSARRDRPAPPARPSDTAPQPPGDVAAGVWDGVAARVPGGGSAQLEAELVPFALATGARPMRTWLPRLTDEG